MISPAFWAEQNRWAGHHPQGVSPTVQWLQYFGKLWQAVRRPDVRPVLAPLMGTVYTVGGYILPFYHSAILHGLTMEKSPYRLGRSYITGMCWRIMK